MKSPVGVESAQVIDTLGVADTLRDDLRSLESETAWMAISTSRKTYPDETVLKYARWAQEHTGAFTLVVSDWVQLYNWAAEHEGSADSETGVTFTDPMQSGTGLSWETFFTGKHVKELDRSARRRVEQIEVLFEAHGVDGGVALWEEMLGKVVEESQETDVAGAEFLNREHDRLTWTIAQNPAARLAVSAIHRQRAPELVDRLIAKGRPAAEVDEIMQGYSIEEIFMTVLQAKTGRGTIKIGPEWERLYDQISSAYMAVAHGPEEPAPAFGAVYLK